MSERTNRRLAKKVREKEAARRVCGSCTECCTALSIPVILKPAGTPCLNLIPKPGHGCEVYEDRPAACRDFKCLWLQGMPGAERPDASGVMFTVTDDRSQYPKQVLVARELREGAIDESMTLLMRLAKGQLIILVTGPTGERRRLMGPEEEVHAAQEMMRKRLNVLPDGAVAVKKPYESLH